MSVYVHGKDKNEILDDLVKVAHPGSDIHEQQKMGIIVRCTEDIEKALASLEKSMNNNALASDKLATKIYWLNVILATATVVAAIVAVAQFYLSK